MPSFNSVQLMGNLTRDPEVKHLPSGTAVAEIGLAVSRQWFDQKTKEKKEETTFVDVTFFGRIAEVCGEYLSKGKPIFCTGRLSLDQWEDRQTGQKRSKLKVIGEQMQMLGSRDNQRNQASRSEPESKPDWATEGEKIDDDDVPF